MIPWMLQAHAVYLYDEKVLITFNYKDGTKTITFDEIAAKDAPAGNGSDLVNFAPPIKGTGLGWCLFCGKDGADENRAAACRPQAISPAGCCLARGRISTISARSRRLHFGTGGNILILDRFQYYSNSTF